MNTSADIRDATDAAARTTSRLRSLIISWRDAPEQLHHLQDDIDRFPTLLETITQNEETARLLTVPNDLTFSRELTVARRSLEGIQVVLTEIMPEQGIFHTSFTAEESRSLDAKRRHRWILRRDDIARSQRSLQLSCQHILSRLITLNLSVSVGISEAAQEHEQLLKEIHHHLIGREEKFDAATSRIMLQESINPGVSIPGSSARHVRGPLGPIQTEFRGGHNEPRFQHLQQVVSNITRPRDREGHRDHLFQPRRCEVKMREGLCRCRCHDSQSKLQDFRLLAFTRTLGNISFTFWGASGKECDYPCCTTERSKWVKATYTFPMWLFHATITLFTNFTASPEFILRVHRRIPNSSDTLHNGTLYTAVASGDINSVKHLLWRKEVAITDVKAVGGESILHTAFNLRYRVKDLSMIRFLIQEGADWFQAKDNGHVPWLYAFQYIFADPNASESSRKELMSLVPLDLMIESALLSDVHRIVLGILHVDIREFLGVGPRDVNVLDFAGFSPLCYAAARADEAAVQALLDAGADVDFPRDEETAKPLHVACQNGNLEVVKRLLQARADANVKSYWSRTPLIWLAKSQIQHNHSGDSDLVAIARELIQAGADVSHEDSEQGAAIDYAAAFNHAKLIQYLLACGAKVDHQDQEGSTPLMVAIVYDARDSVAVLLCNGADYQMVDHKGLSFLHYIALFATSEMMQFVSELAETGALVGISVTRQTQEGLTPLQSFERRSAAFTELREHFERLLNRLCRSMDTAAVSAIENIAICSANEDDDEFYDEFYDAMEAPA